MPALVVGVLIGLLAGARSGSAQVALAGVFGNHMVLQAGRPVPVWGTARPRERITLTIGEVTASAVAGVTGRWGTTLPAPPPGGPFELVVRGSGIAGEVRVSDVLVGEVWLVAGCANMALPVSLAGDARTTVEGALRPRVRFARVPQRAAGEPLRDVPLAWTPILPRSVLDVSAVAYAFACELQDVLDVPVGIVQATYPFSRIAPWIPRSGLSAVPALSGVLARVDARSAEHRAALVPALDPFEDWLGEARAAIEAGLDVPPAPPVPRNPLASGDEAMGIYDGMISPLVPYSIRGVLWHQGEQDIGSGAFYAELQRGLVLGWRAAWGCDDLPFLAVQLSPYRYGQNRPTEKPEDGTDPLRLPELWEAQARLLELPDTGLVVTTDLGPVDVFFQPDKAEVGKRLASWALSHSYGRKGRVYSGPIERAVTRGGEVGSASGQAWEEASASRGEVRCEALTVGFHGGQGLATSDGGDPTWFELAGDDGAFRPAQARIEGQAVRVWCADVPHPRAVRYGWHQEAQGNLVNGAGLPAMPFRATLE